jgi:hypothetical protein
MNVSNSLANGTPNAFKAAAFAAPYRPKEEEPFFAEERDGWRFYVEWEKHDELNRPIVPSPH